MSTAVTGFTSPEPLAGHIICYLPIYRTWILLFELTFLKTLKHPRFDGKRVFDGKLEHRKIGGNLCC